MSVQHKAPAAASIAKAFDKSALAQNTQQQHEVGPPLKALFEEAAKAKASDVNQFKMPLPDAYTSSPAGVVSTVEVAPMARTGL
jgi:hypothetical protein